MIDKYAYHVQHVFDAQASVYTNISFPPVHTNTLQRIAYPVCPFQNVLTLSVSPPPPPPPPVSFRGQKHHLLPHPMPPLSWCARSAGPQWFDRVSLAVCTISPQWTLLSACPQPFNQGRSKKKKDRDAETLIELSGITCNRWCDQCALLVLIWDFRR